MQRVGRHCLIAASAVALLSATAWAGGNLQHYPKDTSNEDIRAEMKVIKISLGVSCEHCHQYKPKKDWAVDIEMKKTARNMLDMVDKIQDKLFTKDFLGIKDDKATLPKATCYMCHKGKEKPEYKPAKADDEKKFNDACKTDKNKAMAASMKKVVDKINKDHFTWKDAPKATCWMCHHGELEFKTKAPEGD
jgi:hypothetical protein